MIYIYTYIYCIPNPSQIFYNVSGESGYDSKPEIYIYIYIYQ